MKKSEMVCLGKICIGGLISLILGAIFYGTLEILGILKKRLTRVKVYDRVKSKDEYCPHCGYYCTGKTIFCTKGLKNK